MPRLVPHPTDPILVLDLDTRTMYDRNTRQPVQGPTTGQPSAMSAEAPPAAQAQPEPRRGMMGLLEQIAESRVDPASLIKAYDPLSPDRPLKDRLWDVAMFAGPSAGVELGQAAFTGLAKSGAFPAIGRALFSMGGGAIAGAPFGKPTEGAISGLIGTATGEGLDYLGRAVGWGLRGGASGVAKRFVNAIGEKTGLGPLAKTGKEVMGNIGEWKKLYLDKIYEPIKEQVRTIWPKNAASTVMKEIYDAGRGANVLPKTVFDQLEAGAAVKSRMNELLLKGKIKARELQLKLAKAQTPEEQKALKEAYQEAEIQNQAEREVLADLPTFKEADKPPVVTFKDMDDTVAHLNNKGWGKEGEPRSGPLSPDERKAAHLLKEETVKFIPDGNIADKYSLARDHAHGWYAAENLIKASKYTDQEFPKIPKLQRSYRDYHDDMKVAFGKDYADILTKSLFEGRTDLERGSRAWGGEHGALHGSSAGFGATLRSHLMPPLLVRPDRVPLQSLLRTGLPSSVAGSLMPPSDDEPGIEKAKRLRQTLIPPSPPGQSGWLDYIPGSDKE